MTNKQYSIALTVTYVPYIVAELPSNLLLKVRRCILFKVHLAYQRIGRRPQLDATRDDHHVGGGHHAAR